MKGVFLALPILPVGADIRKSDLISHNRFSFVFVFLFYTISFLIARIYIEKVSKM